MNVRNAVGYCARRCRSARAGGRLGLSLSLTLATRLSMGMAGAGCSSAATIERQGRDAEGPGAAADSGVPPGPVDLADAGAPGSGPDHAEAGPATTSAPPPVRDASVGSADGGLAAGSRRDAATAGGGDAAAASGDAGAGSAGPEQCANRAPVDASWKLVWSDEFDEDGAPDPANWGYEKGFVRNQELQWYQPDNATVSGGLLTIAAQRQTVTNPNFVSGSSDWKKSRQTAQYTSTSMTTSGKRSFQYGRFEACAQIDTRAGSWPAFWSLGNGRSWPSSGEVDIMEYYASGVRANVCKPSGSNCDWTGSVSQSLSSLGSGWSNAFHLWAMEWDATSINLSLDDKLVYGFSIANAGATSTSAYTGNPFYILVNQAIGANGGDPSNTTFPIVYKVDYVRVYQH
ncbi:MAG: family 16 glycosylhydrolase [Myxococcales bacterium]|nr:family 16 glycosylhydrolase [Myxococcales bacterium]